MSPAPPLGPAFRRFAASSGLANLADGIATLAWAWLASLLTRDPLLIALVPVALRLPWFLFALPAGIVTDRTDRRRLILSMDMLRALAFAGAALAVLAALPLPPAPDEGVSSPGLFAAMMLAALAVGIAEVFRDNAAQTMLPAIVPGARLEAANGRLWSVEMIGNSLIGPPLGALLVGAALAAPFAANAAFYAGAAFLIASVAGRFRAPPPDAPRRIGRELAEGFGFLWREKLLRLLAAVTGIWNLCFHMTTVAFVLYAQEALGLGATGYGFVLAAGAAGGILAGFLGERAAARLGPARLAQATLAASAPCFALMVAWPSPWLAAFAFFLFEFTGLLWNTVSVSYRQRAIPDALLGRVNSLYRLLAWGMIPLGLVLSGLIVRWAEGVIPRDAALTLPFWIAAAGALLLTVAAWRGLGRGFASRG
jgi:MFS family permease